ncbi:MAG: UPF0175 family protein [Calditrichaeota bacterium]|nr:MAG: UPF0175 family protein [Calditrichota bacterium]
MAVHVTLNLPEGLFSITRTSPEEFVRELCLAAAVKWYQMERISQSKVAQLAGMSRSEFIDALHHFRVSPIQTTVEELREEWENE